MVSKQQKPLGIRSKTACTLHEDCGKTLSIGCGSGLFESILKDDYGIEITHGIEPSTGMAEIAGKRGLEVKIGTAEDADFGFDEWDTVLFNGTPSYISDLEKAGEESLLRLIRKEAK